MMLARRLVLLMMVTICGCASISSQTGTAEIFDQKLSTRSMRVVVHEFGHLFMAALEETADDVLEEESDTGIRLNVLRWKSNTASAILASAFYSDPFVSAVDMRVLYVQLLDFLESEYGSRFFGRWQDHMVAETRQLGADAQLINNEISAQLGIQQGEKVKEFARSWAEDYPIENLELNRPTVALALVGTIDHERYKGLSAVQKIEDHIQDFAGRSRLYALNTPKQVRWQSEIVLAETFQRPELKEARKLLTSLQGRVDRIDELAQAIPSEVDRQRRAVKAMIAAEREVVLADVERVARLVLDRLSTERALILENVDAKANELLAEATGAVKRERALIVDDARTLLDTFADILFWRGVALLIIAFFGLCGVALFTLWAQERFIRRRGPSAGARQTREEPS